MAIDYMIDTTCIPRDTFTLPEMLQLLKDKQRAEQVIEAHRREGDESPPDAINFEVARRDAGGFEHIHVMVASDAIARVDQLAPIIAAYDTCQDFKLGSFHDCFGALNYPISNKAELWLLEQLPGVEDPVLFLMLMRTVQEFGYTGQQTRDIRDQVGVFFQNPDTFARRYAEMDVTTDVVFEMMFLLGPIQPAHGVMLLFFFNAIPRDAITPEAFKALWENTLSPTEFIEQYPFLHQIQDEDEASIRDMKHFLWALYRAYVMHAQVLLDV